jgi:uncharacterized protein
MIKTRCPICDREMPGQQKDWPEYPFCSPRCRKIDLGRWLGERYRLPEPEQKNTESESDRESAED